MARSIKEIKDSMTSTFIKERAVISAYSLNVNKTFDQQYSSVSIESILFYVFAFAVWTLEKLFDSHTSEISTSIEQLEPHTLRWYVNKTKSFLYGYKLVNDADYYDTSNMSDSDIIAASLVKYAVATETNTVVYIKVAGQDADFKPCLLNTSVFSALESYINTIKDAGVSVKLRNEPADHIKISLVVYYNPTLMDVHGQLSDASMPVNVAVQQVITNLPFNGVFRNTDLLDAIKEIPAVEVCDIIYVKSKADNALEYVDVVGYNKPYSGYYSIDELLVEYKEYKTIDIENV